MRRSTAAVVQDGYPLGKLILLGIPSYTLFYGYGKCPGLLSNNVIFLYNNARPHRRQQARNLLQTFGWETLDHPHTVQILSPFLALKEHLSERCFTVDECMETCYYHMADATGIYVLCVQDGQIYSTL
jgi:hypothetical protein